MLGRRIVDFGHERSCSQLILYGIVVKFVRTKEMLKENKTKGLGGLTVSIA